MRRRTEKRLPDFDYTAPGPYWVTIKLHRPQPLFGSVHDDGVHLSDIGEMIDAEWQNLPSRYPSVALDAYVVMPDHIHGLLTLFESPLSAPGLTLGRVIGTFKSVTTINYGRGVRERGWMPYERYFWLEDYYEHVVRGEADLISKRLYVERNPWRWRARERSEG